MSHQPPSGRSSTGFVFQESFLQEWFEPGHPENPHRVEAILRELSRDRFIDRLIPVNPHFDPLPYIAAVHSPEHIRAILDLDPVGPVALTAVAGGLAATQQVCTRALKNAFCCLRPPGHHVMNSGCEEGFCFFNTIAIAARYAQHHHNCQKVLIVDWDYHHGNGTEEAFYDDPSVLYFSTHNLHAYPGTGYAARTGCGAAKGTTINVPMASGSGDRDFIHVFQTVLKPAALHFKPDLVLISAGFDAHAGDLLGNFDVSDSGFAQLTDIVMEIAASCSQGRLVSFLEGGYTPTDLATAVRRHIERLMC